MVQGAPNPLLCTQEEDKWCDVNLTRQSPDDQWRVLHARQVDARHPGLITADQESIGLSVHDTGEDRNPMRITSVVPGDDIRRKHLAPTEDSWSGRRTRNDCSRQSFNGGAVVELRGKE